MLHLNTDDVTHVYEYEHLTVLYALSLCTFLNASYDSTVEQRGGLILTF